MPLNAFDHVETLHREFAGASDRAAAVVAGAFLDEVLHELLQDAFVKRSKEGQRKLFHGNGPLSTFSAKIELAFSLGLISEHEHFVLNSIRGIRNEFAHELGDLSFQSQSVLNRCQSIAPPIAMIAPRRIPLPLAGEEPSVPEVVKADAGNGRALFEESVVTLASCLFARAAARHPSTRACSPKNFEGAHEPAEMVLKHLKDNHEEIRQLAEELRQRLNEVSCSPAAEEIPKPDQVADTSRAAMVIRAQEFVVQQIKRAHKLV